jgi:hypothetical protein
MPWPDRAPALAILVGVLAWALAAPVVVMAASPTPSPLGGGDPRSSGTGPGLVGDPLAALVIVAAIAALTVVATLLYVRLTAGRASGTGPGR